MSLNNSKKLPADPEEFWSKLLDDLIGKQAELSSATTPPMPSLGRMRIPIKEIVRKYYYILLALPEKEFDRALRDLYWAAVIEQSKPGRRRAKIDAEGAVLYESVLKDLDLRRSNFRGASLYFSNLTGASLQKADLTEAQLQGATLGRAKLNSAVLRFASLQDATLTGAILRNANLTAADFRGATLHRADLRGARCWGADFSFADLSKANLQGADLSGVAYNALTVWPARLPKPLEGKRPLEGPTGASFDELMLIVQQEVQSQVPMLSDANAERVTTYILKKIVEAETGFRPRRGAVVRFIKKLELDRLVRYDTEVSRYILNLGAGVTANQAKHMVNVVAREVSRYQILMISDPGRPAATKKKGKQDALEGHRD